MSEVQARLRAALVAIAEENVDWLYRKTIEDAIWTLDDGIRPEEDAQGTVSGACAAVGRLDLLVEARALGYPWNAKTCVKAAKYGQLECLKYAHEHGCRWDELTCGAAAYVNEIECLRYAQDHGAPDSAHYVVDWQRMYVSAVDLIVRIALSHQRDGYVSLRELTPTVNRFLRAWPELDVREEVKRQLREYFDFDPLEEPPPPRERFSTMIDLYATK